MLVLDLNTFSEAKQEIKRTFESPSMHVSMTSLETEIRASYIKDQKGFRVNTTFHNIYEDRKCSSEPSKPRQCYHILPLYVNI
jgi:hypothetical protein